MNVRILYFWVTKWRNIYKNNTIFLYYNAALYKIQHWEHKSIEITLHWISIQMFKVTYLKKLENITKLCKNKPSHNNRKSNYLRQHLYSTNVISTPLQTNKTNGAQSKMTEKQPAVEVCIHSKV